MKKSLLISWISGCDYPLFRLWLDKYGNRFDEILIYWDVQFRHPFFWAFIQQSLSHLPNVKFLDPVEYQYGVGDWRNVSTNELVKHATGDWLISIEQDWFTRDWEWMWEKIEIGMNQADLFGWMNMSANPYIHPAFWFIKRELLEKTNKDFAAHPEINGSDHFGTITYDAQRIGAKIVSLQDLGVNCDFSIDSDAFHLGGVNQNYLNGLNPEFKFHRPEAFAVLNYENRQAQVVQDPKFITLSQGIEQRMVITEFDLSNNEWTKFFKI